MIRLLFFFLLFLEVLATAQIAIAFGGMALFGEIVLSAVLGMIILGSLRYRLAEAFALMQKGHLTPEQVVASGVGRVMGGVLLIIPGVLTDLLGLFLQSGLFGALVAKATWMEGGPSKNRYNTNRKGDEDVIDVEVIEPSDSERR